MKKFRVLLSLLLAMAMMLSLAVNAAAAFPDTAGHWAQTYIENWQDKGLVAGYEDGTFRPDGILTRAEFAACVNNLLQHPAAASPFQDVKEGDWFYAPVTALAAQGFLAPDASGNFRPNEPMTRQDAAVLFAGAFGLLDAPEAAADFADLAEIEAVGAVGAMVKAGFITGYPDKTFKPDGSITRAEAMTIFNAAEEMTNFYLNAKKYEGDMAALGLKPYTGPAMAKGLDKAQSEIYIDPARGNQQPITGYYYLTMDVEGVERTAKVYIPEVAPLRCYFTVITVPDGWNTEEFLLESGWLTVADKAQEALFILEAAGGEGQWGTPAEEYAYVKTAMGSAGLEGKSFYNLHGVHYLAGYGTGGTALQEWAVNTPLKVISAAFINTEDLSKETLDAVGERLFNDGTGGFPTSLFLDPVPYAEVPVPVWFVNEDLDKVDNLKDYFAEANDCKSSSKNTEYGTTYWQKDDSDRWVTNASDILSQVTVKEGKVAYDDPAFTQQLHDFLTYYTRYDNTSVYGSVLGERLQYDDENLDINNLYVEEDGVTWKREYLVYVPDNSAEKFPEGAPVVYVFAGGSQGSRLFMDATHWWEVADEHGFIVCVPCSQYSGGANTPIETRWNMTDEDVFDSDGNLIRERADDFAFVEKLVAAVDAEYKTDPNRRFATGQSNGSMFSRNLAQRLPHLFAAVGSTSATSDVFPDATTDVIPVFLQYGENDNGGSNDAGYKAYDIVNNHSGNPFKTLAYWFDRNGAVVADPENPTASAVFTEDQGPLGRQHYYTWSNKAGVPVYRYGWTDGRSHNCSVDDMWLLWESWFVNWSLAEDGSRLYSPSGFAKDDAQVLPLTK